MLQFKDFKKHYGSHLVLSIPDLILENEVYWLQGANGSGKSSLLKCISGLLPFDGDILFSGNSLKKQSSKYLSKVNYAPTEPVFPTFLSGRSMIDFFVSCKKDTLGNYHELIQIFDMKDYLELPLAQYSSGMLKKLSIVLAFIGASKLIILDEPFITLDPLSSKILEQWICDSRNKDFGIIFSSHQVEIPFEAISLRIENKQLLINC
ncbi:ABC transporter, ATP-binding protein [Sphingobacterium faecium PCAi_F2.5]|nr:ABC transporter, ATP-binding protein [Sphingobacterium faecium PCAi_F2.5]